MNLSADEMTLAAAARNREPGALRSLALRLDERLGDEDVRLDGAVMAWRAVKGSSRRFVKRRAAVLKGLGYLRRRFAGAQSVPAWAPPVTLPRPGDRQRAQDHRPAA